MKIKTYYVIFLMIELLGVSLVMGTLGYEHDWFFKSTDKEKYENENTTFYLALGGIIVLIPIGLGFLGKIPELEKIKVLEEWNS